MPAKSSDPLRKITLNLYDSDVEELSVRFGHGWSEIVRGWVHEKLKQKPSPITIGDLRPRGMYDMDWESD